MKIRKSLSVILAMAMSLSLVNVAMAATPADTSIEPKVEIKATDIIDGTEYDLGEGKFAIIDTNLIIPDGTLSDKITYNNITKRATGQGIASFTVKALYDADMFDSASSYVIATDGVGECGYDAASGRMSYALGVGAKDTYVGTLAPFFQCYMLLKDDTLTVDKINATEFADANFVKLTIDKYENGTAPTVSTVYSLAGDTTADFDDIGVTVGTGKPVIEEKDPVVTGVTVTADKDVAADGETVTFTAVVEGTEGVAADGSAIPVPQDVVWSDNVVGGVYTAVADYEDKEVTVTATAKGTEISGSKTITVSKKAHEVVAPVITGITIAPETVTVKGGETVTFTATVEGTDGQDETGAVVPYDKTVTWSANATEGAFTAPAATDEVQTFEVTATAADGKTTATATVTVEAKEAPATVVTVTDATATTNETYKAQNTMYWGVKIVNGLKGAVQAWMTADAETSKTTTLDFSNVTINGDAEFGVFTKVAAERLDKAISLHVKDVAADVEGASTAASYNSLIAE